MFGLTLLGDPTLCPKQAINSNLRVLSVTPAHGVTVGQVTRISSEFTQDILLGDLDSSTFFLSEAGLDRRLGTPDDLIIVGDVSTVSPRIASLVS